MYKLSSGKERQARDHFNVHRETFRQLQFLSIAHSWDLSSEELPRDKGIRQQGQ